MRFRIFMEGIEDLRPDTELLVYHGTDIKWAASMCSVGIDAFERKGRLYPHYSAGKPVDRGLFIAPSAEIASQFGDVVLELRVLGKYLFHMFPADQKNADRAWKKY